MLTKYCYEILEYRLNVIVVQIFFFTSKLCDDACDGACDEKHKKQSLTRCCHLSILYKNFSQSNLDFAKNQEYEFCYLKEKSSQETGMVSAIMSSNQVKEVPIH